jgi:hypothetical protein
VAFCRRARHAAVAWKGGGLFLHEFTFPALAHLGVEPEIPGCFGQRISLLRYQLDRFSFECRGIGTAFVWHHRTPPLAILPRLSRCPFLLNHNNPSGCTITLLLTDLIGDPGLGPFTDTREPGEGYFPLLSTSPAINTGNDAACPKTDQLGEKRVGPCDMGAIEFPEKIISSR